MRYYFYTIILSVLLCSACEESTPIESVFNLSSSVKLDTMPQYTEQGRQTFAYKVDGKVVLNGSEFDTLIGIHRGFFFDSFSGKWVFYVKGISDRSRAYQEVGITIDNVIDTGIYIAKQGAQENQSQMQYLVGKNSITNIIYNTTNTHLGYLHLKKIDRENRIIAGTFRFTAFLTFGGMPYDTVNVTDGWFDIKY